MFAELNSTKLWDALGSYSVGFLDAAVALFDRAKSGTGLVDCTFYPAAYCLRHGVELFIKQMSLYAAYEMRDKKLLYTPNHDLAAAWKLTRPYVEDVAERAAEFEPEIDHVHHFHVIESMVEELHELDARSTWLRYPEFVRTDKKTGERIGRADTFMPFNVVHLGDWHAKAEATLEAVQDLEDEGSDRTGILRGERNEYGNIADAVMGYPDSGDGADVEAGM
jgi:hypothetical protein